MAEPILIGSNLVLDGEAVRNPDGNYRLDSLRGWEEHFAGTGKRIPTVGEYVAVFKQLYEQNNPALDGILQDLNESGLCAGKIDYRSSNLPIGSGFVDELIIDYCWQKALEDELFLCNAFDAVNVLWEASGKRPYILTPDAEERKSALEKAAWFCIYPSGFNLDCDNDHFSIIDRARGVYEVSAAKEVSNIAIPEMKISPASVVQHDNSKQAGQTGYKPTDLAYARRLLDGLPSGTVMDWEKATASK
ncbi:MAG: hypothetical protein AABY40_01705 [Nanoarchaeota archaeon]